MENGWRHNVHNAYTLLVLKEHSTSGVQNPLMRLVYKLFLLISLSAMLSAMAVAGVLAWNLDRGFTAYLDARDEEQFDEFVARFETRLGEIAHPREGGGNAALIQTTMEQLARDGLIRPPPPDGRRRFSGSSDGPGSFPRPDRASGRWQGGLRPPPDAFDRRLRILDDSGQTLFGRPPVSENVGASGLSWPIERDGMRVATVELLPRGPSPRAIDANFLRSQYIGLFAVTLVMLVLSALAAYLLARVGVRRISALDDVTNKIAAGNLGARTEARGNDEIALVSANINKMAASLEKLEGARRRWLAEISHELRTPLSILTGELEALRNGIRPMNEPAVLSLSEEVDQLNHLIEDLHFLAVSDLGSPPINLDATDAVAIVEDAAARFRLYLEEQGLRLTVDTGTLGGLCVNWDRQRIDQVLANLITNAGRYTDAPGEVRLSLWVDDDFVEITVEDSPPGVSGDQYQQLFEPLYRIGVARDRASGGSGLGLSVAKAIVVAHGGEIIAKEARMGGLMVMLRLPLDPNAE